VRAVAPVVRARTQVVFGNRNWVPLYIYGTTPEFLDVRDWTDLSEGEPFSDRDVRNGSKVCLVGQTLVRELFQGRSPVGQEVRVQNVAFRVVGVLAGKGANMMGLDQDDILLAPWTTIKYRVSGSTLGSVNQSTATATDPSKTVNSLSGLYPSAAIQFYPVPSPTQSADTPQPVRFTNVDQILVASETEEQIPAAVREITQLLHERHRIRAGQPDDFNVRDMTEMTKSARLNDLADDEAAVVRGADFARRRRRRHHEYHAGVGDGADEGIGLRMAVGARARDILRQFLVEATVLCLLGGGLGIGAGWLGSFCVSYFLKWPTERSWLAVVAAVAVSGTVASSSVTIPRGRRRSSTRSKRFATNDGMLHVAFKEWSSVCTALATGRQSLILRKGGIAEAGGVFRPEYDRFWLYPTYFHQGADSGNAPPVGVVRLSHFVEVADVVNVASLDAALRLAGLHVWDEATVRQRFVYRTPGLYALTVRVWACDAAEVPERPEYAGCKSWVQLGEGLPTDGAMPMLDDAAFAAVRAEIAERLGERPV